MSETHYAQQQQAPHKVDLAVDAAIIGGGLAGIALAKGLHDNGYNILLFERQARAQPAFKGEYLQPRAVQILRSVGLGAVLESDEVNRVSELRFRDLEADNQAVLSDILMPYPPGYFAASLPHYDTIVKMRQAARTHLHERFWEGAQVQFVGETREVGGPHVLAVQDAAGQQIGVRARWLFGADGRHSLTRDHLQLGAVEKAGKPTWGAPVEYIVGAEVTQQPINGQRYEVIRTFHSGTISAFRIKGEVRRVYWNAKADAHAKGGKSAWSAELRHLFQTVPALDALGDIEHSPIHAAAANSALAARCISDNAAIVGDAAGITTPLGGQGMTVALLHVDHILRTFDLGSATDARTRRAQLQRYQQFADRTYRRINLLNFGLYHLFFSRRPAAKLATHHVLRHWQKHPELAQRTMRLFAGIDSDTPSPLELMQLWGFRSGTLLPNMLRAVDHMPLRSFPKWFST